jgi:hypothetical protein
MNTLRSQMLDWNDLSLAMQEAADDIWAEYGIDAVRVFCMGA